MKKLTILIIAMLLLLTTDYGLQTAIAVVPHLINYQGRLTDISGKPLADGAQAITFRIYDSESAGNMLWEETQSVTIQKGIFSVFLGGSTNLDLPFDKPYFLEIKVGTEVMSPRQRITSAGYALRAEKAESAEGTIKATGGLTIETRTSDPASPAAGQFWLRTDL